MSKSAAPRVLLVAENVDDARLLDELLARPRGHFSVHRIATLDHIVTTPTADRFDAALLTADLSVADGQHVIAGLRSLAPALPIIVITDHCADDLGLSAVQQGAEDYLIKTELDRARLQRSLRCAIERKRFQGRMARLAYHDQLTGLANRALLRERIARAIVRSDRSRSLLAVLHLDLDHFKSVTDALGSEVADDLLRQVAQRLQEVVRESDTVARLNGDEFAVFLEGIKSAHGAAAVADKVISRISEPFAAGAHSLYIGASIGIAVYPYCGKTVESLLCNAGSAMYRAKDNGRNRFQFYTRDMNARALDRLRLETDLRRAVDNQEFVLHYQPKLDLRSGKVTGTEALIRWNHPRDGLVYPGRFITALEEIGLIGEVGKWVIETACRQNRGWHEAGLETGKVAVNLSGVQLMRRDLSTYVADILSRTGLAPELLEVELTERLLIKDTEACVDVLQTLREHGVGIAIDDFGTGYCSFSYLKKFLVNTLKIDRSFISNITSSAADAAITSAIIGLARKLDINVVAEGVEQQQQLDYLRRQKTDEVQGYLFSPPVPADAMNRVIDLQARFSPNRIDRTRCNTVAA